MYFDWHSPTSTHSPSYRITYNSWHSRPFFRHHQNAWSYTGPKLDLKQACFLTIPQYSFYIRALCHIRPALTESMAASLGASLVQSRLDYANSIMYGMSASNMHKLQSVKNSLTRVVLPSLRHLSASERLNYLHWLPVHYRLQFKIATLTYKILATCQPYYLYNLLQV